MSGSRSIWCSTAFVWLAASPVITILISFSVLSGSQARAQGFCFENAVNYAVGPDPQSVSAADLDGDDVAVYHGRLIAAGSFTTAGGLPANHIAQWNGDDDSDDDRVPNPTDDRLPAYNPNQENADSDQIGDSWDNRIFVTNQDQADADQDGIGDARTDCGNELAFDGEDIVTIPHSPLLTFSSTSTFTIEFWYKLEAAQSIYHLISKRTYCSPGPGWNYQIARDEQSHLMFSSYGPDNNVTIGDPAVGEWTHVAVTYDGSRLVGYLNGTQTVEASSYTVYGENTEPVTIGSGALSCPYRLYGQMDEVRIWSVARDSSAVSYWFNKKVNPTEPGLLAYWSFDEDSGQVVRDLTPNALHGTLGETGSVEESDPVRQSTDAPLADCDVVLPSDLVVSSLSNSGVGSLRSAIAAANTHSGPDTITFAVAGTISLSSPLPTLSDLTGSTLIDGLSAPGASPGSPTVILDGLSLSSGSGIDITSPANVIRGLEIRNFPGSGIVVRTPAARFNTLSDNRTHGNRGLGIDLNADGITPNDPGDGDSGPNDKLNFPVFDSVVQTGADTFSVFGTAAPKSRVELYLAAEWGNRLFQPQGTNHGPAYHLLGWTLASASGLFAIDSIAKPQWSQVTATATDTLGNTSEFAQNKLLTPDPLRISGYSEPVPPLRDVMSLPLSSPALQVVVYSPPVMGHIDSIGPSFNTFGSRASYDSLTDYDSGGLPDTRVKIASPDTGEYKIKYVLIGDPGSYTTGIGIDGHAEVKRQVAFAAMGQIDSSTYHLAPPLRGDLNGDGVFDVLDVIASIGMTFSGKPLPDPPDLLDVNCDQVSDVFDVIDLISFVFVNGPAPCQ